MVGRRELRWTIRSTSAIKARTPIASRWCNRRRCFHPRMINCRRVGYSPARASPTALDYVLEYSTDNINFYLDNGSGVQKTISPNTITITDTNYAANMGINKPNVATNVYWRIGAKVDGEADPYILSETQLKYNYVFSPLEVFTYQPPPNPSLSRRYSPGSPGGKLPLGSGRNGSSSRL